MVGISHRDLASGLISFWCCPVQIQHYGESVVVQCVDEIDDSVAIGCSLEFGENVVEASQPAV